MVGGIFIGVNLIMVIREFVYQFCDSGVSYMFVVEVVLKMGFEVVKEVGLFRDCVFIFGGNIFVVFELIVFMNLSLGVQGKVEGV